jgi:hypothetical protein
LEGFAMGYKRQVAAVVLMLAAGTAMAGDNWWTPTKDTLPQLIAAGYQVIGFAAFPDRNPLGEMRVNRYLLQKGSSVVTCTEFVSPSMTGSMTKATCSTLNATE